MTDTTPTTNQRILLDVIGNLPATWDIDVTYPTLPEVTHSFSSLPELVLRSPDGTQEVAARAIITADKVFHGYVVTTTAPEHGIITADCRERRLTSLSQGELLADGLSITHHPGLKPTSDAAVGASLSLSAAASLAGYYASTLDPEASSEHDHDPATVPTADD